MDTIPNLVYRLMDGWMGSIWIVPGQCTQQSASIGLEFWFTFRLLPRGSALRFTQDVIRNILHRSLDRLFAEKHGRGIILHANYCSQSLPLLLPLDWSCINHLVYDKNSPDSSGSVPNFCAYFKPRYSSDLSHGVLRICLQSDWPLTA